MAITMNLQDKLHQGFVIDRLRENKNADSTKGPLVVEFDTTETCMMACPGCISEDLVNHSNSFSSERLLELAAEMTEAGVKAVILIGGGEPLAHPAVGDFMRYLGDHDVHLGITTNGVLIDRYLETIAKYASWTRVSMDAGTPETFMKLRPPKTGNNFWYRIIDNMKSLAKMKTGKLGFSFLIRTEADGFGIESNIGEIYQAAVLAKEIGCDYFEVKPSYSYAGGQAHALVRHAPERMDEARKEIMRLKNLETEEFHIVQAINLEDSLLGVNRRQEKEYQLCPVADLRTLVTPSGVYVCPYWRGKDRFRIGNVQNHSFMEVWNSTQRNNVMNYADPGRVCQFHCLRHNSNLELLRMEHNPNIEEVEEYDRFI
jgi:MoaA/NifB/PqqE/SkfB family radical SAM enzyme